MVRRCRIHQRFVSAFIVTHCFASHCRNRLKGKGLDISKSGMSVKTDKRFNREEYLDATQRSASGPTPVSQALTYLCPCDSRGFIKAFKASTTGNQQPDDGPQRKGSLGGKRGVLGRRAQVVDK